MVLSDVHVAHGRRDRRMAHQLLDRHHVNPQLGAPATEGVTQIVEPALANLNFLLCKLLLENVLLTKLLSSYCFIL